MDVKKLDMVAEYYSTEGSAYKRDKTLAGEGKEVYVSESDPNKRLRFQMQPSGSLMASLMNGNGEIRSWDTYDISRCEPWLVCVARAAEGERRVISFDNKDVQDMIQQFGERGKMDTIEHIECVIPVVRDLQAKEILEITRDRLSALSDEDGTDLVAFIKKYKNIEHERSIRVRLEKAKAQVKARDAVRQPRMRDGRHKMEESL